MDTRNQINIALIGPVSAGKTTMMNTLFVKQYANMKIKRTTMMPQVYYETKKSTNIVTKKKLKNGTTKLIKNTSS